LDIVSSLMKQWVLYLLEGLLWCLTSDGRKTIDQTASPPGNEFLSPHLKTDLFSRLLHQSRRYRASSPLIIVEKIPLLEHLSYSFGQLESVLEIARVGSQIRVMNKPCALWLELFAETAKIVAQCIDLGISQGLKAEDKIDALVL